MCGEHTRNTWRTVCDNAADGLRLRCEHPRNGLRTFREMRNEHTVRRRG